GNLRGVSMLPSSTNAYAVGAKAHIRFCFQQSAFQVKEVFTPPLNGEHFMNSQNGFVVGNSYTIRYTNDGGATWNLTLPATFTVTPDVQTAYTTGANTALVAGTKNFFAHANGNTIATIPVSISPSVTFYDIAFSNSLDGIVAGGNSSTGRIIYTKAGPATSAWLNAPAQPLSSFRAAWGFARNNTFLIAGTQGRVTGFDINSVSYMTSLPSSITHPAPNNVTLNDIFFHDDIAGYVVGDHGSVYRSTGFNINPTVSGYPLTAGSWTQQISADGLSGQSNAQKINLTSVAFASRYDGFLGGDYAYSPNAGLYARMLHDESNLFSTRFWYDRLGRIVVSQNTKQFNRIPNKAYSYTLYDALGRVTEAGEKSDTTGNYSSAPCNCACYFSSTGTVQTFADIFG
ncbi:MAG TPA: hypothetical protein VII99_03570, partial [Bacteroidia bacterium]